MMAQTNIDKLAAYADKALQRSVTQEHLRRFAREQLEIARRRWSLAEQRARSYIHKNPEKALMIAAGIGIALGTVVGAVIRERKRQA